MALFGSLDSLSNHRTKRDGRVFLRRSHVIALGHAVFDADRIGVCVLCMPCLVTVMDHLKNRPVAPNHVWADTLDAGFKKWEMVPSTLRLVV